MKVPVAEQKILALEEQIFGTADDAERLRLLQLLIQQLLEFEKDIAFSTTIERHIVKIAERVERQRELIARLKRAGQETADAYFLLVTLKTTAVLLDYHRAMARKILVCVLPPKN